MASVFAAEETGRVRGVLESVLGGQSYAHAKTAAWCEAIADRVMEGAGLPGHKLVVDVLLLEKGEAGFKSYSSVRWNEQTDAVLSVRFENDTLRATATLWAMKC
jgi:hypothetical protein